MIKATLTAVTENHDICEFTSNLFQITFVFVFVCFFTVAIDTADAVLLFIYRYNENIPK